MYMYDSITETGICYLLYKAFQTDQAVIRSTDILYSFLHPKHIKINLLTWNIELCL